MAVAKRSGAVRKLKSAAAPAPEHRLNFFTPLLFAAGILLPIAWWVQAHYTVTVQTPMRLRFQSPVVFTERMNADALEGAEIDQNGRSLTRWQRYACAKFGTECRLALAIQRAENPQGNCEIYHYNNNGTLDWGYFQINTVHLQRPDVNLRDLLDCKANIDFAYRLYVERRGFTPWSTYNNGRYRQFLVQP
jgi:hypothetical protein